LKLTGRLLSVAADNASNNSTILAEVQKHYAQKDPANVFIVESNQVECMAHVPNHGAQQILENLKLPVDSDKYEPGSDSADHLVTAALRLAFLSRK